ncbi:MAG TPA: hypothetical protein VGS06_11330, partial [Streptosporangiaceae bacterium]|nr:hypothetical protein [Streptosporangiaceae bacterium]
RTDPCLASKFGMFSRLAADEEMPSAERVISGRARRRSGMTRVGQLPYRLRMLLCICGRDLPAADTNKGVSETARRHLVADHVPASPEEKDSRRRSSHADGG